MASNLEKIIQADKKLKDSIRKQQFMSQQNLNKRLDGMRFKNISSAGYDSSEGNHYDETVYLVDKGDHIELYKGDTPISGKGGGLIIENGVVVDNLKNSPSLPSRFGWAYIGTGDYSETASIKATDHKSVTHASIPDEYNVYEGGGVGRIILDDYLRGVVFNQNDVEPVPRASDGKSSVTFKIKRQGSEQIETLSYELIMGAARKAQGNYFAGSYTISTHHNFFILGKRTIGDTIQKFIFNFDNYTSTNPNSGGTAGSMQEPNEDVRGDQFVLTVAFKTLNDDLIPYLYIESSKEQLNSDGQLIETSSSRYLAQILYESQTQHKALGLLYDPETLERLPDPIFYDLPEENLIAGRIISYDENEDVTI